MTSLNSSKTLQNSLSNWTRGCPYFLNLRIKTFNQIRFQNRWHKSKIFNRIKLQMKKLFNFKVYWCKSISSKTIQIFQLIRQDTTVLKVKVQCHLLHLPDKSIRIVLETNLNFQMEISQTIITLIWSLNRNTLKRTIMDTVQAVML